MISKQGCLCVWFFCSSNSEIVCFLFFTLKYSWLGGHDFVLSNTVCGCIFSFQFPPYPPSPFFLRFEFTFPLWTPEMSSIVHWMWCWENISVPQYFPSQIWCKGFVPVTFTNLSIFCIGFYFFRASSLRKAKCWLWKLLSVDKLAKEVCFWSIYLNSYTGK